MTPTKGRLFYIPTNRACGPSLTRYLQEAARLREIQDSPVLFALIERDDKPYVADHGQRIALAVAETGLSAYHLTKTVQWSFISRVVNAAGFYGDEAAALTALLLPEGVCYGAGPNKAALFAAALGADTMHRRDSDTNPLIHDGAPRYAAELEARLAGFTINSLSEEVGNAESVDRDSPILFVGSDYVGDPPVDRMELAELSLDLMLEHERLEHPTATYEDLEKGVRRYFLERNANVYLHDSVEVDTTGATELGVSCIHRVFLDLPEMPIRATLGCDYFQKNLLYRLRWPVLYHNRRVLHQFSSDRNTRGDLDQFVDYNLMDTRYKLLWRIWSRHNRNMEAHRAELRNAPEGSVIDALWYADSFDMAVQNTDSDELYQIVADLVEVYRKAFHISKGVAKFGRLADVLNANSKSLITDVVTGIGDYTKLIRTWPRLIGGAKEIGETL
jgi:hypothetical protein